MTLPDEWIDRLIQRFREIYGGRFQFDEMKAIEKIFYKAIWKNGLMNMTNAEIKRGLYFCDLRKHDKLPHVVEFWHWCKGLRYIKPERKN